MPHDQQHHAVFVSTKCVRSLKKMHVETNLVALHCESRDFSANLMTWIKDHFSADSCNLVQSAFLL